MANPQARARQEAMTELRLTVPEEFHGERLDKTLAGLLRHSRSFAQQQLARGGVLLGGRPAKKSAVLQEGDELTCFLDEPKQLAAQPEHIPLDVRYEDDDLLVVNKPQGMVVHPAPGNLEHTLVNALLYHCQGTLSGINGVIRPGIVHRIDKDTSGLLMVAKNDAAHLCLARQIAEHTFKREYQAVVHGTMQAPQGLIDAPIGRNPNDRIRMAVTNVNAKPARTHWQLAAQYARFAQVRLQLETGRTHQIRVHMAHMRHPLAGDPVYGPKPPAQGLAGQCLHAALLGFVHPRTGEYREIAAELPDYFVAFLRKIDKGSH
jgi:23S rRNA pseudouridine1911/1915/1917 synthase